MAIPPPVLGGYKYKQQQLDAAAVSANTATAQERTVRDRQYDLQRAQETAATTNIAAGGAAACTAAAVQARVDAADFDRRAVGLSNKDARPLTGQRKQAIAKAQLLEGLAAQTDPERQQSIVDATQAVAVAQAAATAEAQTLADLQQTAQTQQAAAAAIPDLNAAWAKNHAEAGRSMRSLEADLRAMQADLARLPNAPPGAAAYCAALETRLDHDAHHVPCARCHAEHGIDRTAQAKAAVQALFQRMNTLGALPDNTGLNPQEVRDRSIATDMNQLKAAGAGKMLGILICTDGTVLQAFSGDSAGRDDVAGWCVHVPPADQGGTFTTRNGVQVPLTALPVMAGTPHGVCAAPKLIQRAYALGLVPAGIAEVWYGGGIVQPHGALVASCSTCRANLDVQLCNNYH